MKERRDPRTRSGGSETGALVYDEQRADGSAVLASLRAAKAQHIEGDFWLCTCAERGANEDHFFGPVEQA